MEVHEITQNESFNRLLLMVCVNKMMVCIINKNISSTMTKCFLLVFIPQYLSKLIHSRFFPGYRPNQCEVAPTTTTTVAPDKQLAVCLLCRDNATSLFLLSFSAEAVMFKNIKLNTGGPTNLMFLLSSFYITVALCSHF